MKLPGASSKRPDLHPRRLSILFFVLLLGVLPALGESLSSANFQMEVGASVGGSGSGGPYRICAGEGCMAVPVPADGGGSPPPPGGGGGGGGGAYVVEILPPPSPAAEEATAVRAEPPRATPAAASPPPRFVPPLPAPDPDLPPAPVEPVPWPLLAVVAAGALAALGFAGARVWRVPAAAEEGVAVAPGTEVIGANCPFCGDLIKGVGLIRLCPACRAVHHAECWEENGGCTTLGCARGPDHGAPAAEA